jgi:hypothetical protein
VRAAADAEASLGDALWRAVDAKASATETVDGRQQPQRAEWLAAAKTVTAGAGDVAAASELVDLQVKPFVDRDVGSDWLAAMRAAASSIEAAFDAAIARVTAPAAVFGVPGDLGPRAEPSGYVGLTGGGAATTAPVHTSPAAAVGFAPAPVAPAFASPPPAAGPVGPEVAPSPASAASALPPAASSMPSVPPTPSTPTMGDLGAGTSTLGSGLSGFGQQLADLIGGLVGSANAGGPDAELDDAAEPDDVDEAEEPDEEDGTVEDPAEPAAEDVEEPVSEPATEPAAEEPAPTPASTPAPLPPEPPPAPQGLPEAVAEAIPEDAEPTPCEIAADELPQVGE